MLSTLKLFYKESGLDFKFSTFFLSKRLVTILTLLILLFIILLNPFKAIASTFSDQAVSLINSERQKVGFSPYNNSDKLTQAAHEHNNTMFSCAQKYGINSCFSHQVTLLNEPYFFDRIKATGYSPKAASENIAWGYTSPNLVVNAWMGSSGHKANIFGNYKEIGCDYLNGLNGNYQGMYWTCDFGASSSPQPTVTPTPLPSSAPTSTSTPTPTKTIVPTPTSSPQKPWWCIYAPTYPLCR